MFDKTLKYIYTVSAKKLSHILQLCYIAILGGKRPLGRTRLRWEDNIKMDLQEVGCGGMDWIELTQDRDW